MRIGCAKVHISIDKDPWEKGVWFGVRWFNRAWAVMLRAE
jgi:hypothetical protein